ncbi:MAG: glycoside hydrolase family 13 protein [Bacteroidales bacterium]|nr:glycoside hydrolase family 13 protein [Bacteroidales bacterium]
MHVNKGPQWAKNAVWYQIFPERFCRANSNNPITASDIEGTTPFALNRKHPWQIHSWTSDWYETDECEKQNNAPLKTNMLRRRYCGDVNGIIQKLDYLQELGVNALYITPLQYSPSLHKYDGTNYLHTDPFFGSDPRKDIEIIKKEDFDDYGNASWTTADRETLTLIEQAHAHGMKIVFDGVFNHIGYNSVPFQDVLHRREKSKYASWFHINFEKSTKKELCYDKFWGFVKEMPKLNYNSKEVQRYVFATLRRWLKPVVDGKERQGIDGWRIDHAIGVPMDFWRKARRYVKMIAPDSLFLGELIEPEDVIKPYLNEGIFDSIMNYGLLEAACRFFAAEKCHYTAQEFDQRLKELLSLYPTDCNYMMQNMLGTHDTERIASYIVNRRLKSFGNIGKFFANSHADDKNYRTRKPFANERLIQKMMIVFQFAFIGSPMIYYGDEAGMWGANDPDCRKPMMWDGIDFSPEYRISNGIRCGTYDKLEFSSDMCNFYKKLTTLRNKYSALRTGEWRTLAVAQEERVYAFERYNKQNSVIFVFNREKTARTITLKNIKREVLTDYLTGRTFTPSSSKIELTIPPATSFVLI